MSAQVSAQMPAQVLAQVSVSVLARLCGCQKKGFGFAFRVPSLIERSNVHTLTSAYFLKLPQARRIVRSAHRAAASACEALRSHRRRALRPHIARPQAEQRQQQKRASHASLGVFSRRWLAFGAVEYRHL
jgi:hypothetical protein